MIMPQPTQKFLMTVDIQEDHIDDIPVRPVSPHHQISIDESKRNIEEEKQRIEMLKIDPMYDYKQTLEYKLKIMQEQMQDIEKRHQDIESNYAQEEKHLEEVYQVQQEEMNKMKKEAAVKYIDSMESYIEDKIEPIETEAQTAQLLAANKELYAQIDVLLSKRIAQTLPVQPLQPLQSQEPKPAQRQTVKFGITPTVMKKPQNFVRRPQNAKGMVNKRMTDAFKLTEEVIKLSQKHDVRRSR